MIRAATYNYVQLIPPDQTERLIAPVSRGPGSVGAINVSPVVAGRRHIGVDR